MTQWQVGDYFWAPFLPHEGRRGNWLVYIDSPVIGRVIEAHSMWVRAKTLALKGRDNWADFAFGDDRIVRLTEDQAHALVAVCQLTGEVPQIEDFVNHG